MRYLPGHKQATRRRILDAAADLFRRHGYEGVGVQDIMKAAGLTHGGFYNHFTSKKALFRAVMGRDADFVRRMRAREGTTKAALRKGARAISAAYLDPAHLDAIGRGCPMAALTPDVARSDTATRKAFARGLRDLEREFARGLDAGTDPDPRALAAIALAVGGVSLARATGDRTLREAMLAACEAEIGRVLARRTP